MPHRLKNSGHYNTKFFVTPNEFGDILNFFEPAQAKFEIPRLSRPIHDLNQVHQRYKIYYDYYTMAKKGERLEYLEPVYGIDLLLDSERSSFFLKGDGIQFADAPTLMEDGLSYSARWAKDTLPFLSLSFQKGFPIFEEDEKGEYYFYEDIREHRPLTYDFFFEISKYIKSITKPFKFFAPNAYPHKEYKTSVRISNDALEAVSSGWVFKKHQLQVLA